MPLVVREIFALTGSFEKQLELGITRLKKLPLKEIEETLDLLADILSIRYRSRNRFFLNWDEVREMRDSGLISFGSHTASYQILTTLKKEEIKKELSISRDTLLTKGVVDPSFIPFCYPNGDYTKK